MLPNRIMEAFELDIQRLEEVEDSKSSTVVRCELTNGETVFVKIPFSKIKFEREREAYDILKNNVRTPSLLATWEGDDTYSGALLLSKLEGISLAQQKASPNVAYEVGILQGNMHNVAPPDKTVLKGIDNEFSNWTGFVERQFYSFAEDVKEVMEASLYKKAIVHFEKLKDLLPAPDGPSFVHMDFRAANILVDDKGIAGVLDFESVRFGSTEIDFTKLYRDYLSKDSALFDAFQEGYKTVRPMINLELVLSFYQFVDAFNSIGWSKRRGLEEHFDFYKENAERVKNFVL